MIALRTFGQDLLDTMESARKGSVPARSIVPAVRQQTLDELMEARMREALEKVYEARAARMVSQPWRITRAVLGVQRAPQWPWPGIDATEMLALCRQRIAICEEQGRVGHWSSFDMTRINELRAAEKALLQVIGNTTRDALVEGLREGR